MAPLRREGQRLGEEKRHLVPMRRILRVDCSPAKGMFALP